MRETNVDLLAARLEGQTAELRLSAILYLPDAESTGRAGRKLPGIVVGHGAGSRATHHADFCREACAQGFVVLAPDLRGHGDSEGTADGPLELDLLAAVSFVRDHPLVDPHSVCYRGSSMGGFYGLKTAVTAGFAALVLICPANEQVMLRAFSTVAGGEAPVGAAPSWQPEATRWDRRRMREYFRRQDSCALAGSVDSPVLLVHARSDDQVPLSHSLTLAAHLRTDTMLVALEGGSHSSAQHDPAVHALSLAWLTAQLEKRRNAETGLVSEG